MFQGIKSKKLKRKLKDINNQINKGELSLEDARKKINELYSSGKITVFDARLIDGILFRKDLRNEVIQKT